MVRTRIVTAAVGLLVVGSVIAAGAATTRPGDPTTVSASVETARAQQGPDLEALAPRGLWNPTTGRGEIVLDGRSSYRVYQGESDVSRWLHVDGSDITEPSPEPTPPSTPEPTLSPGPSPTAEPTPTEGGGPGFDTTLAIIALIVVALLSPLL